MARDGKVIQNNQLVSCMHKLTFSHFKRKKYEIITLSLKLPVIKMHILYTIVPINVYEGDDHTELQILHIIQYIKNLYSIVYVQYLKWR